MNNEEDKKNELSENQTKLIETARKLSTSSNILPTINEDESLNNIKPNNNLSILYEEEEGEEEKEPETRESNDNNSNNNNMINDMDGGSGKVKKRKSIINIFNHSISRHTHRKAKSSSSSNYTNDSRSDKEKEKSKFFTLKRRDKRKHNNLNDSQIVKNDSNATLNNSPSSSIVDINTTPTLNEKIDSVGMEKKKKTSIFHIKNSISKIIPGKNMN